MTFPTVIFQFVLTIFLFVNFEVDVKVLQRIPYYPTTGSCSEKGSALKRKQRSQNATMTG